MKKLVVLFVLIWSISGCKTQQNVNNFYDKYQGTENSMSFQAPLFLASLMLDGDQEIDAFRKKVQSVRILTLNDLGKSEYAAVQNEVKNAMTKDGFENWFNINNDGNTISVSAQNRGKSVRNVVVSMQGLNNLIFVNAKTKLTEKELTSFITKIMSSKDKSKSNQKN